MSHDNLRPGIPIRLRRDTAANWSTDNPILKLGETGWVTDTTPVRVKFGDGVTAWNDLPFAADEAADVAAEASTRAAADTALDGRLDVVERPSITFAPLPSGDITGVTDAPILNAGMLALSVGGGGIYQLARGTYWGNAIIAVPSNVTLRGLGRAVTFIKQSAAANIYSFVRNKNFVTSDSAIAVLDLTIDGNKANQTGYSECTSFQNVTDLRLDIDVVDAFKEGVHIHGCADVQVNIAATNCDRDGVVFDVSTTDGVTPCTNVSGVIGTRYCGWANRSTIAAASDGLSLPQASITVVDAAGWPTSGALVVVATPASGIPVCNYLTFSGRTGNTLTGVESSGTGVLATGGLLGIPQRSGVTLRAAQEFDLIVHSYNPGYHGTDITNSSKFGKVRATTRLAGRYGVYCGLGPTEIDVDFHTTGSGFGGIGTEYTLPRADCRFVGTSDGDQYGGVHDTSSGITHRGIVKNSQKHGVWIAGSDHCVIDLELAYNNGQLADNSYRDVQVTDNSTVGAHPAANSIRNDIRVGASVATATNKVSHVVATLSNTQTHNRVSIGSIDGAHNPVFISGGDTSNTRNFVVPSGGVNPLGHYVLPATGSFAIDPRNGRLQTSTMTGDVTISFGGGNAPGDELALILTQDGTGGHAVAWAGSNVAARPYTPTAADQSDARRFLWNGTTWIENGTSAQPRFAAGTTATAIGTAAKTATISGYTPTTGDVLALTFTNGTTATSPTLSINGGAALSLAVAGATVVSFSAMTIAAGGVALFYYSGSRWEAFGPQFSVGTTDQATAEAGSSTSLGWWTSQRVRQNVAAATLPTSTTAALAAIGNAVNTTGKYAGKTYYNTTTKKLATADGATAGSVWVDATGATTHTPV